MTSKMVSEVTRLWLHITPYSQKDKYKSRHSIKEGASGHQRRQQGCPVIERKIMAANDNGRDHNDQEKNNSRGNQHIQENQEKHNKRERRIYVPNNKKIQEEILKENYDSVDVGHPGQHRMLELLKRTYWWPGLKENIKKYIQECFKC